MITNIRLTTLDDLHRVMELYDIARDFMRENGNSSQWIDGYPSEKFIAEEIADNHSYVCENHEGEIVATFCFIYGNDPTYEKIYYGQWLDNESYATIHRMASSGEEKGVGVACFDYCFSQHPNIRVDTHRDNLVMQNIMEKYGFTYCGIIYVSNGSERLAYQKKLMV